MIIFKASFANTLCEKRLLWRGASQWRIYNHRKWGQLSTTCSNLLKQPNGELVVAVDHNQLRTLRTMVSEMVDPIDWSHTPPSMIDCFLGDAFGICHTSFGILFCSVVLDVESVVPVFNWRCVWVWHFTFSTVSIQDQVWADAQSLWCSLPPSYALREISELREIRLWEK